MSEDAKKLEALLFYKAEPLTFDEAARALDVRPEEIGDAASELAQTLAGRGITLVKTRNELALATAPELEEFIARLHKDETEKNLTKTALETLAIIVYRGPLSKSHVDFIRGVNSQFILRNLLIRGLVTRSEPHGHARGYVYEPSAELIAHLGIHTLAELEGYNEYREKISHILEAYGDQEHHSDAQKD